MLAVEVVVEVLPVQHVDEIGQVAGAASTDTNFSAGYRSHRPADDELDDATCVAP